MIEEEEAVVVKKKRRKRSKVKMGKKFFYDSFSAITANKVCIRADIGVGLVYLYISVWFC